jgi:hypothetical protein
MNDVHVPLVSNASYSSSVLEIEQLGPAFCFFVEKWKDAPSSRSMALGVRFLPPTSFRLYPWADTKKPIRLEPTGQPTNVESPPAHGPNHSVPSDKRCRTNGFFTCLQGSRVRHAKGQMQRLLRSPGCRRIRLPGLARRASTLPPCCSAGQFRTVSLRSIRNSCRLPYSSPTRHNRISSNQDPVSWLNSFA